MDVIPMDEARAAELIDRFRSKAVLVLGDVMLDRFIWGSVSRISPEAPVPVVRVERESAYPGAPPTWRATSTPSWPACTQWA